MFRRGQRLRVLVRWEYAGQGRLYLTTADVLTAFTAQCKEPDLFLTIGQGLKWSVAERVGYTVVWVTPELSVKQTRMYFDVWLRGPTMSEDKWSVFDEVARSLRAGHEVNAATLHRKTLVEFRDNRELVYTVDGSVRLTVLGEHVAWLREHPEAIHANPHAAQ